MDELILRICLILRQRKKNIWCTCFSTLILASAEASPSQCLMVVYQSDLLLI